MPLIRLKGELMYTIVSGYPEAISEKKISLMPDTFEIPAAEKGDFHVLHVDHAVTFRYIDEARGTDRRPIFDKELAEAICADLSKAKIEVDASAGPALYAIEGKLSKEDILKDKSLKKQLDEALARQNVWFQRLVQRADDDWAKYKRHTVINALQRKAANYLGLGNKEWALELSQMLIANCKFCGSPVRPEVIVCPTCHNVLNKEAYAREGGIIASGTYAIAGSEVKQGAPVK